MDLKNGQVVLGGPDWRTLNYDVLGDSLAPDLDPKRGRPPAELDFDLVELTSRLLAGCVAVCTAHPFLVRTHAVYRCLFLHP